ncbi:MAG TPA: hypothetical protein VGD65_18490 [Chryseosolibacter sp.]
MKTPLLFLFGTDIPSAIFILLLFALLGLGIFIFIEWVFHKLLPGPTSRTKTSVFITLLLTPAVIVIIALLVLIPWQNQLGDSSLKQLKQEDSLARRTDSLERVASVPQGIRLDTIVYSDSGTNTEIALLVPVSGNKHLDQEIRDQMENESKRFVRFVDELIHRDSSLSLYGSTFNTEFVKGHRDEKIVSYLLMTSFYHAESGFPMPSYHSVNFDVKKNRLLSFSDYFNLSAKADTALFKSQIIAAFGHRDVNIPNLNEIDFTIDEDFVWFNLSDFETNSFVGNITHAKVQKASLSAYIRPAYK